MHQLQLTFLFLLVFFSGHHSVVLLFAFYAKPQVLCVQLYCLGICKLISQKNVIRSFRHGYVAANGMYQDASGDPCEVNGITTEDLLVVPCPFCSLF